MQSLYVISCPVSGYAKVGRSVSAHDRLERILYFFQYPKIINPSNLAVAFETKSTAAAYQVERVAHKMLHKYCFSAYDELLMEHRIISAANEWYLCSPEDGLTAIALAAEAFNAYDIIESQINQDAVVKRWVKTLPERIARQNETKLKLEAHARATAPNKLKGVGV